MTVSRKNRNNMNKNKNKNKNRNNRNKQTRNKRLRKNTRNKRLRKNTRNKRYSRKKRMRGGAKTHKFEPTYPQQIAKRLNAYRGLPSVSHPSNSRYTRRPRLQNEFESELNLLSQFKDETNPGELYKLRQQLQRYTNKYPSPPVMSPHPELKYGMHPNQAIGKIRRPQMWEFTTDIPSMQKLITDAARRMGNIPTQGPRELYAMTNAERKAILNSTNGRGIIGDNNDLWHISNLKEAARAARAARAAYSQ
jgi:hypothetical protein